MKLVSFSLYGSDQKYQTGAVENALKILDQMPDWQCRFFVSTDISTDLVEKLIDVGAQVIRRDASSGSKGMFWRFDAAFDQNYQHVIFRDCDSRISEREYLAIQHWVKSGKDLHIIRDHPMHDAPILGGLWGVRPKSVIDLEVQFLNYAPKGYYGEDQEFLARKIYRKLRKDAIVHDSFFLRERGVQKFAMQRSAWEYCGEPYDAMGQISQELRSMLQETEESKRRIIALRMKSFLRQCLGK
jgi:hypothetical protein